MRLRPRLVLAGVCGLAGCATTPSSVPGYLESHHHLQIQNGYVRVMETRLKPGQETLAHSHPIEAAVIFLTGGQLRIRDDDGAVREVALKRHSVNFGSAPTVHRTGNIGEETVRVIVVEVFSQPPALSGVASPPSLSEALLENDKVWMSRVRLTPGDAVHLSGATPSVVVATSRAKLFFGGRRTALDSGGALWCEAESGDLRNGGQTAFEAVVVTLKPRIADTKP